MYNSSIIRRLPTAAASNPDVVAVDREVVARVAQARVHPGHAVHDARRVVARVKRSPCSTACSSRP